MYVMEMNVLIHVEIALVILIDGIMKMDNQSNVKVIIMVVINVKMEISLASSDGSECTIDDTTTTEQSAAETCGSVTEYAECDSNQWDRTNNDNCNNCQSWGCVNCKDGYFKKSWQYECISCTTFDANYQKCNDWNGCTKCD